ncbi:MAG: hypothetical protein ACE5JA_06200 [bacterium]
MHSGARTTTILALTALSRGDNILTDRLRGRQFTEIANLGDIVPGSHLARGLLLFRAIRREDRKE